MFFFIIDRWYQPGCISMNLFNFIFVYFIIRTPYDIAILKTWPNNRLIYVSKERFEGLCNKHLQTIPKSLLDNNFQLLINYNHQINVQLYIQGRPIVITFIPWLVVTLSKLVRKKKIWQLTAMYHSDHITMHSTTVITSSDLSHSIYFCIISK